MMMVILQVQRTSGLWQSAEYSTFSISDEVGKYLLTVAGYSGDASDSMAGSNPVVNAYGKMFTTAETDNDGAPGNCALTSGSGGWW